MDAARSSPVSGASHQVVLRPMATPLPLAYLALFVATTSFSSVELGWVAESEAAVVALSVLVLSVPLQLLAAVVGFLTRDAVAGTGTGILAGTWAAAALTTFRVAPGKSIPGLGVILLASATALLVPTVAGRAKGVAAAVLAACALRFAVTGVAELSGSPAWLAAAGWVGLVLAALSLYAAFAFELEGTGHDAVPPTGRAGRAAQAMTSGSSGSHELDTEPGVRHQL